MLRSLPFRWLPESITQEQVMAMLGIAVKGLPYNKRFIFDRLITAGGNFSVSDCPDLEELEFPVLTQFAGDAGLFINNNPKLVSVNLPNLTVLGPDNTTGPLAIQNNPKLTTISFPQLATWGGSAYMLDGNAFTAETVNHILARMAADPAFQYRFVMMDGGTSAAPTGQGLIDQATLEARGCTIMTNGAA